MYVPENAAIDISVLIQLAGDLSPADLRRIAAMFEADMARLLPLLTEAAAAGDKAAWHCILHGIAGASGAVGGVALDQAARAGGDKVQISQLNLINSLAGETIAGLRHWVATALPAP